MGKTMGTWGKTMEYIGPNQRLWQNLTSTSASSSMDGLVARSLTGTRNAVVPMVSLSTPLAISTFFDDYGERQFAQDVRTKLDYAGQEEANAPFVDGHRELKTLREARMLERDRYWSSTLAVNAGTGSDHVYVLDLEAHTIEPVLKDAADVRLRCVRPLAAK